MKSGADKILVYRLGSLGDTVVAFPALHWIRSRFPAATITLLTNFPVNGKAAPASAILDSTGLANDYLPYPVGTRNLAALLRLRREIASRRFHTVIALAEARSWSKSVRDLLFFQSCGIPRVIGTALRKEDLACRPCPGGDLFESEASRLIRRLGAESQVNLNDDRWWDLRLNARERAGALKLLERHHASGGFIALSLGTKVEVKDWTLSNWRRLVGELGRNYPHLALIGIGVAEELEMTDEVLRLWPGLTANFCGLLSPRMSSAILEQATVFLGHDSGPMHLAAAVGTKCVAIFSARHPPGQWFPRGEGHQVLYHRTECFNCGLSICNTHAKKCILGISVQEVLEATGRVLKHELQRQPRCAPSSAAQMAGYVRSCRNWDQAPENTAGQTKASPFKLDGSE